MIIVRHPSAGGQQQTAQQQQMLVVSAAAANTQQQQQQQMQLIQQNNIRLASSSLSRAASPATAPSPRQQTPGHFMSPRNPLHATLSGTVLSQPATSNETMTLAQQAQQAGYGLNLDLTGLGTTQLGRADGDVTPLTPQDQLSRYVDQL